MGITINQASITKQITAIAKKHKIQNDIATLRTLNIASRRGIAKAARDIRDESGHKISTTKRAIRVKRATRNRQVVTWYISGRRLQFPGVRPIKRRKKTAGISYIGRGKTRIRQMEQIKGGSKPFVIKGRHSSKLIAVYRQPGDKRKVTTYSGHSIPYLMGFEWENNLLKFMRREMAIEYPKQLVKAKFR